MEEKKKKTQIGKCHSKKNCERQKNNCLRGKTGAEGGNFWCQVILIRAWGMLGNNKKKQWGLLLPQTKEKHEEGNG
jgi:hypothetical protein